MYNTDLKGLMSVFNDMVPAKSMAWHLVPSEYFQIMTITMTITAKTEHQFKPLPLTIHLILSLIW